MKKAILTLGLFSMMLVLTSFTAPQEIGGQSAPRSGGSTGPSTGTGYVIGGQSAPRSGGAMTLEIGGQSAPRSGSSTEIGGQSAPRSGSAGTGA